jgi:dihydroxyacetone kinase-like protein
VRKFLNQPAAVQRESLLGFARCHAELVELDRNFAYVRRRTPRPGKVALVSGGGSGHEPLHVGFVGRGMLDAACPGQIFTSPTPDQILAAAQAVDGGAGVLFLVKNYAGDRMNFGLAAELCPQANATVLVADDVAQDAGPRSEGRRGVAGTLVVEKILGAAAEAGASLAQLQALGERVGALTRSMGVALGSCTVPAVGRPTFDLGEGEMELGVGIHGEAGQRRVPLLPADQIARTLVDAIVAELAPAAATELLLLVNGFGATPLQELYLMYGAAARHLARHGCSVARGLTGNFVTSLDMAGCSITLAALDPELRALWDAPVCTPALRWAC